MHTRSPFCSDGDLEAVAHVAATYRRNQEPCPASPQEINPLGLHFGLSFGEYAQVLDLLVRTDQKSTAKSDLFFSNMYGSFNFVVDFKSSNIEHACIYSVLK